MFGIGTTELVVILLVALVILGPKKLPEIARALGKGLGEFKRVSSDLQRTVNYEIEREEQAQRKKQTEAEMAEKEKKKAQEAEAQAKEAEATTETVSAEPVETAAPTAAQPEAAQGTKA